jgi:molybdopterin converting factor small subunit
MVGGFPEPVRRRLLEPHGLPTFPPKTKRSLNANSDYTQDFINRKRRGEIPHRCRASPPFGYDISREKAKFSREPTASASDRRMTALNVTVEFFGIPRQRAGRPELAVPQGTVADVLADIEKACPGLAGLLQSDGRLSPHYLLSINGRRFTTGLEQRLAPGDRLLLLSADAGG